MELNARIVNMKGGRPTAVRVLAFQGGYETLTIIYENRTNGTIQWAEINREGYILEAVVGKDGSEPSDRLFRVGE
jgi:hypothetical protein